MHSSASDKTKERDTDYLVEKLALFIRTSAKASAISKCPSENMLIWWNRL